MEGAFLFFVMITCVGGLLSSYLKTVEDANIAFRSGYGGT